MTKKELWLKLFHENDTALACAIHFCERFVTPENLERGEDFIIQKRRELNKQVDQETVKLIFPQSDDICNETDNPPSTTK